MMDFQFTISLKILNAVINKTNLKKKKIVSLKCICNWSILRMLFFFIKSIYFILINEKKSFEKLCKLFSLFFKLFFNFLLRKKFNWNEENKVLKQFWSLFLKNIYYTSLPYKMWTLVLAGHKGMLKIENNFDNKKKLKQWSR